MKSLAEKPKASPPRKSLVPRSHSYKLSEAKTYLGRLLEKASAGEAIYITRGADKYILQYVPEFEPIPMRPPGYFADLYTPDVIREDNLLAKGSVIEPPRDLE